MLKVASHDPFGWPVLMGHQIGPLRGVLKMIPILTDWLDFQDGSWVTGANGDRKCEENAFSCNAFFHWGPSGRPTCLGSCLVGLSVTTFSSGLLTYLLGLYFYLENGLEFCLVFTNQFLDQHCTTPSYWVPTNFFCMFNRLTSSYTGLFFHLPETQLILFLSFIPWIVFVVLILSFFAAGWQVARQISCQLLKMLYRWPV